MAINQREALIAAVRAQVEKEKAAKAEKAKKEQAAAQLSGNSAANTSSQDGSKPKYKTLSADDLAKIEEKKRRKHATEMGIDLEEENTAEETGVDAASTENVTEKKEAPTEKEEIAAEAKEEPKDKEQDSLGMSVGIQPDKSGKSLSNPAGEGGLGSKPTSGSGLGSLGGVSGGGLGLDIGSGNKTATTTESPKLKMAGVNPKEESKPAAPESKPKENVFTTQADKPKANVNAEKAKLQPTKLTGGDGSVTVISDENSTEDVLSFGSNGDTTVISGSVQWQESEASSAKSKDSDDIISIVPNRATSTGDVKSMYDIDDDDDDALGAEISKLANFGENGAKKQEADANEMTKDEAALKAEEEEKKKAEAEEARKRKLREAEKRAEEQARRIAEAEAKQRADAKQREEAKQRAEEAARKRAEEAALRKAEEEAKRKALEEERQKAAEEARKKATEEARAKAKDKALKAAEEARKQAEEAAKILEEAKKAEEEAARKAEENKKRIEEEAKRKAEEEAKRRAEEEARRVAEEETRKAAEEEARKAAEEEAKRRAEEEARKAAEEEAKRKAEVEAKRKAEEEAKRVAEEARKKAEEAARILEEARKAEEAALKAAEEEARKAEEAALKAAEEEAKHKAEAETKRKAEEEAKRKAEEEAKRKAEEEAKRRAEEEAKRKAEEDLLRKAEEEARRKLEEETRRAEEEAKRKAEEARKILEAAKKAEEEALKAAEAADTISIDLTAPAGDGKLPLAAYYLEKYAKVQKVSDSIIKTFNSIAKNSRDTRNVIIRGEHGFGLTCVGEDYARSFYDMAICKEKTIAKIKAAALNKVKLADAMVKLKGGCLVVENAGLIAPDRFNELISLTTPEQNDVVIILTGESGSIDRLMDSSKADKSKFKYSIDFVGIESSDMLAIAKGYILQRGFKADDSVDGTIRNQLMAMESGNIDRILKAVDDALIKCEDREKAKGISKKYLLSEDFK